MGMALHTISHKRDPRLIIDFDSISQPEEVSLHLTALFREHPDHHCAASIPRLHPPISAYLLPLQCIPCPPFLLFLLGPTPSRMPFVASNHPIGRSSRKILIVWLFCFRL
jgi:hypothetical protein